MVEELVGIISEAEKRYCPNCKKIMARDAAANYCGICGQRLDEKMHLETIRDPRESFGWKERKNCTLIMGRANWKGAYPWGSYVICALENDLYAGNREYYESFIQNKCYELTSYYSNPIITGKYNDDTEYKIADFYINTKTAALRGDTFAQIVLADFYLSKNAEDVAKKIYKIVMESGNYIAAYKYAVLCEDEECLSIFKSIDAKIDNLGTHKEYYKMLEKLKMQKEMREYAIAKAEHGDEYFAQMLGKEYSNGKFPELNTDFDRWVYDNSREILEFAVEHKNLKIDVPCEYRERFCRLLDNKDMSDSIGISVEDDEDAYEKMDISTLEELSDRQDAKAIAELAYRYDEGAGVEKNETLSHELYLKAAQLGDSWSEYAVGWNYENGCGVEQNLNLAKKWYGEAASHGNRNAYQCLSEMKNIVDKKTIGSIAYDSLFYAKKAINLDGYDLAYQLGYALTLKMYKFRWMGFVCFIYAAIRGSVAALNMLGCCYKDNMGVPFRDFEKAVYYFKLASQKDNKYAMYNLASCYELGYGVRKNLGTAAAIYKEAANRGNEGAIQKYDELYVKLRGNVPDNVPELFAQTAEKKRDVSHKDITELHKNVTDYYESGKYADAAHNMRNVLECIVGYFVNLYVPECVNDTIFDKIKVLEESAQIERHYIEIMHSIRMLGNRGAHLGEEPVDLAEDIRIQLEPFNDLVNFYNGFR